MGHKGPGSGGSMHLMGSPKKAKQSKATVLRLWGYLRAERTPLFLVFLLVVASSICALIGPYMIGRAIDSLGIGRGTADFALLGTLVSGLIIIYALGALTSWTHTYMMASISQRTVKAIRKDIFDKVQTLPLRFFDERPRGDVMSRLTNDVENINNSLTQSTIQIFTSVITVTGAITMMIALSPVLALISLIVVPLGLFVTRSITKRTRRFFADQQRELGDMNGYIEEMISGQRVIKAFCREEEAIAIFAKKNMQLKKVGIQAQAFSGFIPPLMNAINNISFALVAAVGGYMTVQGVITIGIITAFLNYSKQFARPINELANQYNMLQAAIAGAERIFEIMDELPEYADQQMSLPLTGIKGEVVFRNVSFGYKPDVPVLKHVELTASPGQTIALVGPTGSGKTTVVNLLMRFYDVNDGSILIDGQDIRDMDKDELRASIGMVLQDTYLFAGTVRDNIRYGRLGATEEEVEQAARLANAHSFIMRLSGGYDAVLTEDGSNISQGQRQLLTIARAILADPAILILDEATSSIDTRTEMHIQRALQILMKGRTSFVIAHRLSTIREADQILVIENGCIIERGTHSELLKMEGFYYRLYMNPLAQEVS
ncbi:multidrug ABC transporter ATP-binding protein [Paenibacillus alvei]|nr:multidrug ABC transporter ATP-binding protein [Paenibacillus alvei]MBG9745041.1 multidrug ABC transporter ATP-binding protein [Paenibacillus alvei]